MALFRRTDRSVGRHISSFWEWWSAQGRALADAVTRGEAEGGALTEQMSARVGAIGPLAWSLNAGDVSTHALVVSADGAPAQLALARRIVLAAPPADETWSYADTRPPAPDLEHVAIGVEGADRVELGLVSVAARLDGTRFDIVLFHPLFSDLNEQARAQVAFLALDAALGELDTELWIGAVQPTEVEPLDGFGLTALRAVVGDLKGQHLDEDGRPSWALLRGETPAGPLLAAARVPLHPVVAPLLDTYVAVVLPYAESTEDGLPSGGSLRRLRDVEDRLEDDLGTQGMVVAHESVAGVRTLHLYVDARTDVLRTVKERARTWSDGPGSVHDQSDPAWESVRHLRG